ncbi:2-phosphosulfolactate phosphatase [Shouchella patagoniensis]|uniref:2-phosphosulfolactate phosphatase n=1 Tax=Shouchella patagoniensis TaxID=228576 RepID=UPI001473088B|nr:2-phosphosulfolactate phosphatase [Shouchella patagoniensis]
MKTCRLWLAKEEIEEVHLPLATVIIIDVMLATTTLVDLMERGAKKIYPVSSIEEALVKKRALGDNVITGGELGGKVIAEFDYGHLPEHYSADLLKEAELVFLSTNGTKAIQETQKAKRRVLANLRNVHSVASWLKKQAIEDLVIVCSGAGGHMAMEDYLCAALLIKELDTKHSMFDDAALFASSQKVNENLVKDLVKRGRVGRYMSRYGMNELLDFISDIGASKSIVEAINPGVLAFIEGGEIDGGNNRGTAR